MTELGLIKRIAEIEGFKCYSHDTNEVVFAKYRNPETGKLTHSYIPYNPLTDKVLLWDLMVKYKVEVDYVNNYVSIHAKKGQRVTYTFVVDFKTNDDLPRSILECIVKSKELNND